MTLRSIYNTLDKTILLFSYVSTTADKVFPNTTMPTTAVAKRTYLNTCFFIRNVRMGHWRTLVTDSAKQETSEQLHDCKSVKFAIKNHQISHHSSYASQPYFVKR